MLISAYLPAPCGGPGRVGLLRAVQWSRVRRWVLGTRLRTWGEQVGTAHLPQPGRGVVWWPVCCARVSVCAWAADALCLCVDRPGWPCGRPGQPGRVAGQPGRVDRPGWPCGRAARPCGRPARPWWQASPAMWAGQPGHVDRPARPPRAAPRIASSCAAMVLLRKPAASQSRAAGRSKSAIVVSHGVVYTVYSERVCC